MPVTFDSYGYEGSVAEVGWSRLSADAGGAYAIRDGASWRVTIDGSGDRNIAIAAGEGSGKGVTDITVEAEVLTLGSVGAGSRWDMIVARRDWSTNTTTFEVVVGSPLKQLPARAIGYGTLDEQPIALCRVEVGKSAVQEVVDLRCWKSGGGLIAMDTLALNYLNALGTQVTVKGVTWQYVLSAAYVESWQRIAPPAGHESAWSAHRTNTDSWSGMGSMIYLSLPSAPAGDYFTTASASVRNHINGTLAMGKHLRYGSAPIGQDEQDDLPGNGLGWVSRQHSAHFRHAGGPLIVQYFVSCDSAQVQSASVILTYLGPVV